MKISGKRKKTEKGLFMLGALTIIKDVLMIKWKTTEMILYFNLSNWLLKKLGIGNEGLIEETQIKKVLPGSISLF